MMNLRVTHKLLLMLTVWHLNQLRSTSSCCSVHSCGSSQFRFGNRSTSHRVVCHMRSHGRIWRSLWTVRWDCSSGFTITRLLNMHVVSLGLPRGHIIQGILLINLSVMMLMMLLLGRVYRVISWDWHPPSGVMLNVMWCTSM